MKKVALSAVAAVFAIGVAFAGAVEAEGHYLWNPISQSFDKTVEAPDPAVVELRCTGSLLDCYYTLDETGTIKNVIDFRN